MPAMDGQMAGQNGLTFFEEPHGYPDPAGNCNSVCLNKRVFFMSNFLKGLNAPPKQATLPTI